MIKLKLKAVPESKFVYAIVVGLYIGFFSTMISADETQDIASVNKVLNSLVPNVKPDSVSDSVLPGMYEAIYGAQVIYVSKDGRYMFEGDLYDLNTRTNLTDNKRRGGRVNLINKLDEKQMIVFSPKVVKHIITTFTDIDCGYCRKMHNQMAEYNKLGIEFRYLAYPRTGIGSPSYLKALSVWCAKDTKEAMSFAKGGAQLEQVRELEQVKGKDCKQTIIDHVEAASQVGVTGTPTMVFENGQVGPGYVEPQRLIKILDQMKKG